MDGLSLLGLVAEQRLGEKEKEDSGQDRGEHEHSKGLEQTLVANSSCVKIERQENGKDSSTNASIKAGKCDYSVGINSITLRGLTNYKRFTNLHVEKSSQSTATHLNVYDFGYFQYKVMENQLCRYSKYTGWHLQRNTGTMKINLSFRANQIQGPMVVRALLVRTNEAYRHFGVDRICDNHKKGAPEESSQHVLQAAPGLEGKWQYGTGGPRPSLCFTIGKSHLETGYSKEMIGLKCICNDSCYTCDDKTFKQTESSRDLLLVLTLESVDNGVTLARRSFGIWPKAVVCSKDLNKPERRKPKGGAAVLNKMQEMLEKQRSRIRGPLEPGIATQGCTQGQPQDGPGLGKGIQKAPIGDGLGLSISTVHMTPKTPVIPGRLSGWGEVGKQTFSLLLPVESTNSTPTTMELMDTTIRQAIKNARTLGLSNEEFIHRIRERLEKGSTEN